MFLNCENIKEYSNKVHEINTDVKKFEDHILLLQLYKLA